jgi:hypothetical protein
MGVTANLLEEEEQERPAQMRSSVRFPLSLPVRIFADVLFHLNVLLPPGTEVEFLIEIPEGNIGPFETAAVHCTGRVVRAYSVPPVAFAAAVIDQYSFQ